MVVYLKNNGISDEICDEFDGKTIIVNYRNKYDTYHHFKICADNEIDGQAFLDLTESNIISYFMSFSIGSYKRCK